MSNLSSVGGGCDCLLTFLQLQNVFVGGEDAPSLKNHFSQMVFESTALPTSRLLFHCFLKQYSIPLGNEQKGLRTAFPITQKSTSWRFLWDLDRTAMAKANKIPLFNPSLSQQS